jgi:sulfite exporter TauE/SafE
MRAPALHAHVHAHGDGTVHAHVHSHATKPTHDHEHAATTAGMMHGLAGTGAAVGLIPVVDLEAPVAAVGYLVVFAFGTIAAMALYGTLAGLVAGRAAARSVRWARGLARAAGVSTILIGCVWLAR